MNYTSYVASLANFMATTTVSNPDFDNFLPNCIQYAEDRIYRELDLLNTVVANSTQTLTAGNRSFALPSNGTNGVFYTVTGINVITPQGATPDTGTRNQLAAVTLDYLNAVWNSNKVLAVPQNFAMINQFNLAVGPWPDENYILEVVGTIQPEPLSATNPTTFLTQYLPDLFFAASMILASGYMRDFGSQSDNPAQSQSWESTYQTLLKSALLLELRKKYAGPGWTPYSSTPISPTR